VIYKKIIVFLKFIFLIFIFYHYGFFKFQTKSIEKFEGLIVSVNSNVLTTYDLSERIKLALKALDLEDNISNRDNVREKVLELLIIEKIKKSEAVKENINHTDDELIDFASLLYNFPREQFEEFKLFINEENSIDVDILMEQLSAELMWKKLLQKKFSSKIIISQQEIEKILNDEKKKQGKYEYNFTEVFFENKTNNDWSESKKKLKNFVSLLDQGISFNNLADKYGFGNENQDSELNWTIEDNLDIEVKKILTEMKEGDISREIKVNDGYKIVKLNRKRIFGYAMLKYSFIKISSFEIENLDFSKFSSISCSDDKFNINEKISAIKLTDVVANEMVNVYLEKLQKLEKGKFSTVISHDNQFSVLKLCDKKNELNQVEQRNKIQNNLYAKKFNQLASTFIANLRKNANIKYFNK
jgi:peptidyl-prolyl cis-trans isomerase SurA